MQVVDVNVAQNNSKMHMAKDYALNMARNNSCPATWQTDMVFI